MDEQRGTQKQIAKRYKDRVDYRNAARPWRRTRFWSSFIAILGGIAAIYFAQDGLHRILQHRPALPSSQPLEKRLRVVPSAGIAQRRWPPGPPRFFRSWTTGFATARPPSRGSIRPVRSATSSTRFTSRTWWKITPARPVTRSIRVRGRCRPSTTLDCAACHNDRAIMQASTALGKQLPPTQFRLNPKVVSTTGASPSCCNCRARRMATRRRLRRSAKAIRPFQLQRENVREADLLRFNHQRTSRGPGIPPTRAGGEAGLQLLPQAGAERPLHAARQFRGELPGVSLSPARREESRLPAAARRCPAGAHISAHLAGAIRASWRGANAG